jgi:PAS domain S-box-containing protein
MDDDDEAAGRIANNLVGKVFLISDPTQENNPTVYVDPEFCSFTGYTEEEFLGRNPKFLQRAGYQGTPEGNNVSSLVKEAITKNKEVVMTLNNRTRTGRPFVHTFRITPRFDRTGAIAFLIGTVESVCIPSNDSTTTVCSLVPSVRPSLTRSHSSVMIFSPK